MYKRKHTSTRSLNNGLVINCIHLSFQADPTHKARSEDAVIAWTWKTFVQVNSSDPEFLLRFPMTKVNLTPDVHKSMITVRFEASYSCVKIYVP